MQCPNISRTFSVIGLSKIASIRNLEEEITQRFWIIEDYKFREENYRAQDSFVARYSSIIRKIKFFVHVWQIKQIYCVNFNEIDSLFSEETCYLWQFLQLIYKNCRR